MARTPGTETSFSAARTEGEEVTIGRGMIHDATSARNVRLGLSGRPGDRMDHGRVLFWASQPYSCGAVVAAVGRRLTE
jgi:hypothetical protein